MPPAPINALMTAVMHLEALWLRAFDAPFGSSLLCLARKPQRRAACVSALRRRTQLDLKIRRPRCRRSCVRRLRSAGTYA